MMLKEYTVKKGITRKVTQKTITGGYNSDENTAEVILTFTTAHQDGLTYQDIEIANQRAQDEVRKVLNYDKGDNWLNEVTHEEGVK